MSTDVGLAAERRTLAQRQRGAAISAAKRLDDSARRDAIADTRTAQE